MVRRRARASAIVQAVAGVMRHRRAVTNFLTAAVRVQQLVARQASDLGGDLTRHVDAGEVASIGTTDVQRIGRLLDVSARGTGAVVSYVIVAALLFASSVRLGLVLVIGAPLFALLVLPVMRPLERRQSAERTARAGGVVAGGRHGGGPAGPARAGRGGGLRRPLRRGLAGRARPPPSAPPSPSQCSTPSRSSCPVPSSSPSPTSGPIWSCPAPSRRGGWWPSTPTPPS